MVGSDLLAPNISVKKARNVFQINLRNSKAKKYVTALLSNGFISITHVNCVANLITYALQSMADSLHFMTQIVRTNLAVWKTFKPENSSIKKRNVAAANFFCCLWLASGLRQIWQYQWVATQGQLYYKDGPFVGTRPSCVCLQTHSCNRLKGA